MAVLSAILVIAAFGGLAVLGAILLVALFRISGGSPDAGSRERDATSYPHGDFEAR